MVEAVLQEYRLSSKQIYSITTDCGSNVLKSSQQLLSQNIDDQYQDDADDEDEVDDNDEDPDQNEQLFQDEDEDVNTAAYAVAKNFTTTPTKCAAHVVQLAVKDFMRMDGRSNFLRVVIAKAKEARKLIRRIRSENCKIAYPRLANETRWGSAFVMVRNTPKFI